MPDTVYAVIGASILSGLLLYFGSMLVLYPQREKLRHIGERTFPEKYQHLLYVWPGSWCTPLAQAITFFRWFGAKSSVAINQLAKEELNGPSYWLLVIHAVAEVAAISSGLFLFITTDVLNIPPPWDR